MGMIISKVDIIVLEVPLAIVENVPTLSYILFLHMHKKDGYSPNTSALSVTGLNVLWTIETNTY